MKNINFKQFAKGKEQKEIKRGGNAIIYTRVSTKKQKEGQSLEVQASGCTRFAEANGFNIVSTFGDESESGKSDTERKNFKKMLDFIDKSKIKIDAVIVYSTSRFSRTGSTLIIERIEKKGIYVYSASSSYDPKTSIGQYQQGVEILGARLDNDNKRQVTIDNSLKALEKGRWISKAPRGYDQHTTKAQQTITINAEGKKLRKAFLWKANERLTTEEIRKRLASEGFFISKQEISKAFRNVFYCGYMAHTFLNGKIAKGNHPALVSEEIFLKVNDVLTKNAQGYEVKAEKEYAPLIGTIKCPNCGNNLTSFINTKMLNKYNKEIGYYNCSRNGCKFCASTKDVHENYDRLINSYALSNASNEIMKVQLEKTFYAMNQENQERASSIQHNIKKKKQELEQAEMNFAIASDSRKQDICQKAIEKMEKDIQFLEGELSQVNKDLSNLQKFINYGIKMRSNLLELWKLQGLNDKKKMQNLIFPEGFSYNKEMRHIKPKKVNQLFTTNGLYQGDSEEKAKGTNSVNCHLSPYVAPKGIKPLS